MTGGGDSAPMPIYKTFGCSAVAACWAEFCTLPIDTAKVRLQLQASAKAGETLKYNGMIGTMGTIAKEEGMAALWAGLTPGLHRCAQVLQHLQ
jgi:solute carrier family 25 (mitochondrial uncoupling protein), member 8/9